MVINKMQLKYVNFVFNKLLFSLKCVGIVFHSSIISSHTITESPMKPDKYLPFLLLHVAGFQIFSHV